MLILVSKTPTTLIADFGADTYRDSLGMLVTPRTGYPDEAIALGAAWAVDNEAYCGFNAADFVACVRGLIGKQGCRFVAVPDVVGDAKATMRRFKRWSGFVRDCGLPVALVAQDGLERMQIDWDAIDALFIGGSTDWKLSEHAYGLCIAAKRRGKWVHMGRVNSPMRIDIAKTFRCDSVDGTSYARYSRRYIPSGVAALTRNYTRSLWEALPCL